MKANEVAAEIGDRSCSSKVKMEDNFRVGVRTVECLRGRLIAERVASKVAKEDAERLGEKLIELENKLRLEIKSKLKAEKKLRLLLKKLSSLEISVAEASEPCWSSSENKVVTSGSSSLGMGENRSTFRSGSTEESSSEGCISETIKSPSKEENPDSARLTSPSKTESKDDSSDNSIEVESNQSCVTEDSSDRSLGFDSYVGGGTGIDENGDRLRVGGGTGIDENGDRLQDNGADDALALVLVLQTLQTEVDSGQQLKKVSGNVREMLDTLEHAREKIQSSLDRRCTRKRPLNRHRKLICQGAV